MTCVSRRPQSQASSYAAETHHGQTDGNESGGSGNGGWADSSLIIVLLTDSERHWAALTLLMGAVRLTFTMSCQREVPDMKVLDSVFANIYPQTRTCTSCAGCQPCCHLISWVLQEFWRSIRYAISAASSCSWALLFPDLIFLHPSWVLLWRWKQSAHFFSLSGYCRFGSSFYPLEVVEHLHFSFIVWMLNWNLEWFNALPLQQYRANVAICLPVTFPISKS